MANTPTLNAIRDDFTNLLDSIHTKHRTHPKRELNSLFLLALEREQIVSVSYRDDLMLARLNSMPIDEELRDILRHALIWVWKDEEMHTVFTRGALLRTGTPLQRLQALSAQAQGWIAGWSSSVCQHVPWHTAPLSNLLARAIVSIGRLLGKVPTYIKKHLEFGPFENFCKFNIDAEHTAAIAWRRITNLSRTIPSLPPAWPNAFARMWRDEDNHRRVFELIDNALLPDNTAHPDLNLQTLCEQLHAISPYFLPRRYRKDISPHHPVGTQAPVYIVQGTAHSDATTSIHTLLNHLDLKLILHQRSQETGVPIPQLRIVIKTSFMMAYNHADPSVYVSPDLTAALIDTLHNLGCTDISIGDSPNLYDRYFQNRSVASVSSLFHPIPPSTHLLDFQSDQTPHTYSRGFGLDTINTHWRNAHLRISFGKLRTHPTELALLSLGNLEGLAARHEDFFFVERIANRNAALMAILDDFPPHISILDAFHYAPDGLLGTIASPNAPSPLRLYASTDPLALDRVALSHIGIHDPTRSPMLNAAIHWFGQPNPSPPTVHGPNTPIPNLRNPHHNDLSTLLSALAEPVFEHASQRGLLCAPCMDPSLFPYKNTPPITVRAFQWMFRTLVGAQLSSKPHRKALSTPQTHTSI